MQGLNLVMPITLHLIKETCGPYVGFIEAGHFGTTHLCDRLKNMNLSWNSRKGLEAEGGPVINQHKGRGIYRGHV